jgi:hypothetical protein
VRTTRTEPVEDEPLEPEFDEALLIRYGTCLDAKPGFECCERAELPKPGLNDHEDNGCEVRQTEPPVVDPAPPEPVSCEDEDKAADDEEHDSEVDDEHCIS